MTGFSFRPITRSEFAGLSGWLAQPHVARWWVDDPALAQRSWLHDDPHSVADIRGWALSDRPA